MSHFKVSDWKSYWSTDPIHHIPIFKQVMSRNMFMKVNEFMKFATLPVDENDSFGKVHLCSFESFDLDSSYLGSGSFQSHQ